MQEPLHLAVTFLEHAPARAASAGDTAELEHLLRQAWETGRGAWPQVALPTSAFMRHLAQGLSETSADGPLMPLLEQLALGDLYLACACVHEVPEAIEALERHYLAQLPAALLYLRLPAAVLDEVCQTVRIHLLVGTAGSSPRLALYMGRGALLNWIRVIAVRMALKQGGPARELPEDNVLAALEALPAPGPDAELDLIRRRHRREFRQAVRQAFAALSGEQRYLLRLHFIDRLSTVEIGALFQVSQSTASRWLKSVRQEIYEQTKRRLQEGLGLSSKEFASFVAAVDSQLDLSLSQILKEEG